MAIAGKTFFLLVFGLISVIIMFVPPVILKRFVALNYNAIIDEYMARKPGVTYFLVLLGLAILLIYALVFAISIGPWK